MIQIRVLATPGHKFAYIHTFEYAESERSEAEEALKSFRAQGADAHWLDVGPVQLELPFEES